MSNESKYNRALHVRARGIVIAGGGKVMTAKSGIKSRQAILSLLEVVSGDYVNVSALLFGSAAEALDNTEIIAAGPVVDYGTRMETEQGGAKVILPKLVFAASRECRLAPEPGRTPGGLEKYSPPHNPPPGLYAALSGRVSWLGEPGIAEGYVRQNVGVAVADFPGLIGVALRFPVGWKAPVRKHSLIFGEGDVVQLGLSDDKARPAMKMEMNNPAFAFNTPQGETQ